MSSSQKFLSRNRAPRVQIEYDVELYGAQKKVQLPFVMGVMSDLSGKSEVPVDPVKDRKFLEIDIDNFDSRMKALKPRAAFSVPNTLSGEGNLAVDLVFEKMSDFSPAAIASKVEPLRKLLEARTQLENLMTYMDGKAGAEELIENLVANPQHLRALALGADSATETEAAFAAMKAAAPDEVEPPLDESGDILSAMAEEAPDVEAETDSSTDVLASLVSEAPEEQAPENNSEDILAGMAESATEEVFVDDTSGGVLAAMAANAPDEAAPDTSVDDMLTGMADGVIDDEPEPEAGGADDILADIATEQAEDAPAKDESAGILAEIAAEVPEEAHDETGVDDMLADMAVNVEEPSEEVDLSDEVLADLAAATPDEDDVDNGIDEVLSDMAESTEVEELEGDASADILAGVTADALEDDTEDSSVADMLSELADSAIEDVVEEDLSSGILADIAADTPDEQEGDTATADTLAGLATEAPEEAEPVDGSADILASISEDALEETAEEDGQTSILEELADGGYEEEALDDNSADILADIATHIPEDEPKDDGLDDLLTDMAESAPDEEEQEDLSDDVLTELISETPEPEQEDSGLDDVLTSLSEEVSADEFEPGSEDDDILAVLATDTAEEVIEDGVEDLLADMAEDLPEDEPEDDGLDDLLASVSENEDADEKEIDSGLDDLLAEVSDTPVEEDDGEDEELDALLTNMADDQPEEDEDEGLDDLLAELSSAEPEGADLDDDSNDILEAIAGEVDSEDEDEAGIEDLLAGMVDDDPEEEEFDLDSLLAGIEGGAEEDDAAGVDDLLASIEGDGDEDEDDNDDLDALLAGMSDEDEEADDSEVNALLEGMLEDADDDTSQDSDTTEDDDSLSALLEDDGEDDDFSALFEDDDDDDLGDLLAGSDDDDDLSALLGGEDDLNDLLGDDDDVDDLLNDDGDLGDIDDLMGDDALEDETPAAPKKPAFQPDFGAMSAAKLQDADGARRKFRIAVLGDFSGRGNRGDLEVGAALGKRKAFKLDFDTMEDVIMRFRTTLTLPLGDDGSAVKVELNELDDLHPDELFENVELFNELNMLRRDLKSGRNFDQNVERMKAWGGEFGGFKALSKKRSKGADAPADLRLTDFQNLIGDSTPNAEASSASDLISRIIGPHIVAAADNGSEEMIAAVDRALSTAMSSVLHHPDFQTVETAWRSIELLGRRVESSAELEVVVYDLSVEEFAADLAAQEDMAESGLFDMLVEKPRQDESAGPISAVVGLYTWEETPTHAELLARMARISAHMDAPFISAISTGFMGVKPEDRHPLVAKTWDALGEMPEAKYLGLATPRFMLRMPYGKKTAPLDRFDYEEFNLKEGMRSMLMANPALLVAVLLAETKARQGGDMSLGSIMSLDDMPFHYMNDQYGDQVALPCTERLLSVSTAAEVVARGFMPVLSTQGQNMVRLGSFQAVGGGELLGIWAGDAAKQMKSGKAQMSTGVGISSKIKQATTPKKGPAGGDTDDANGEGDDDFGLDSDLGDDDDLDLDFDLGGDDDLDLDLDLGDDDDDGLDDLLSGFGDDDDDDDDMDADLAALLGDL